MADLLETYDFSRFPYNEWFDGRIWRLHPGQDFTVKPTTMTAYLRAEARERHQTLDLRVESDSSIVIQAHRATQPRPVDRFSTSA